MLRIKAKDDEKKPAPDKPKDAPKKDDKPAPPKDSPKGDAPKKESKPSGPPAAPKDAPAGPPMGAGMPPAMPGDMGAPPADPTGGPMLPMAQVSPEVARYFDGSGMCANCTYFQQPGSCQIVSGPIDPQGRCNLFSPAVDEAALPVTEPPMEPVDGNPDQLPNNA